MPRRLRLPKLGRKPSPGQMSLDLPDMRTADERYAVVKVEPLPFEQTVMGRSAGRWRRKAKPMYNCGCTAIADRIPCDSCRSGVHCRKHGCNGK